MITIDRAGRQVEAGPAPTRVRARAHGALPTRLAIAAGALPAAGHLDVTDGDETFACTAISPHAPVTNARRDPSTV